MSGIQMRIPISSAEMTGRGLALAAGGGGGGTSLG
jgi:hypothetical protein